LALEASVFGMAVNLLSQPGAQVLSAPPVSVHQLAQYAGATVYEVEQGLKELGIDLLTDPKPITLRAPTATCTHVQNSTAERPDIVDGQSGLAIHILSSGKQFSLLRREPSSPHGQILAINPLFFARGWQLVCNPADAEGTSSMTSTASNNFRDWLATSPEGRGWFSKNDEETVKVQVKDWLAKRRAFLDSRALIAPKRTLIPALSTLPPRPQESPFPPDRPDRTLRINVGGCPVCHGPQDEIRCGSGMWAGKLLRVCRQSPRHPITHLGNCTEA